jgi:hypothetical protein
MQLQEKSIDQEELASVGAEPLLHSGRRSTFYDGSEARWPCVAVRMAPPAAPTPRTYIHPSVKSKMCELSVELSTF